MATGAENQTAYLGAPLEKKKVLALGFETAWEFESCHGSVTHQPGHSENKGTYPCGLQIGAKIWETPTSGYER